MSFILKKENIASLIFFIRGEKVILDSHLALLYDVETKRLKEAVRRNIDRFPGDFMFELTSLELALIESSIETLNLRTQNASSSWGGSRYHPMVFTEQGVAMLSGVLRSKRAVEVNISIMRTFFHMRRLINIPAASGRGICRELFLHSASGGELTPNKIGR